MPVRKKYPAKARLGAEKNRIYLRLLYPVAFKAVVKEHRSLGCKPLCRERDRKWCWRPDPKFHTGFPKHSSDPGVAGSEDVKAICRGKEPVHPGKPRDGQRLGLRSLCKTGFDCVQQGRVLGMRKRQCHRRPIRLQGTGDGDAHDAFIPCYAAPDRCGPYVAIVTNGCVESAPAPADHQKIRIRVVQIRTLHAQPSQTLSCAPVKRQQKVVMYRAAHEVNRDVVRTFS